MWKGIVVGTTALAIAGSSVVYAQQRFGRSERHRALAAEHGGHARVR